jgi:hypothetical protein
MRKVLAWPAAVLLSAAMALMPAPAAAAANEPAVADVMIFGASYTIAPAGWSYTIFDVILVNQGPDMSAEVVLRLTGLDPSIGAGWGYGVPVSTSDRPIDITVTTSSTDPDLSNNVMHAPGVTSESSVGLAQCPAYSGTPTPTPVGTGTTPAPGNAGGGGGTSGGSGNSGTGGSGTQTGSVAGNIVVDTDPTPALSVPSTAGSGLGASAGLNVTGAAAARSTVLPTAARSNRGGDSWGWILAGVGGAIPVVAALVGWQRWRRRAAGQPKTGS